MSSPLESLETGTKLTGTRQCLVDAGRSDHDESLYLAKHVSTVVDFGTAASTREELTRRYQEEGYVTLKGLLSDDDVSRALLSLEDLCEGNNYGFNRAAEKSFKAAAAGTLDFKDGQHHAFIQYERGTEGISDATTASGHNHSKALTAEVESRVRKLMGFCSHDAVLDDIATHPALMSLLKTLLCIPESAELELFQDMALLKGIGGREKPYHQDHAYFNLPLDAKVVGVWIALDEATEQNGCMRCLPSLHRRSSAEKILGKKDLSDILLGGAVEEEVASEVMRVPRYAFTDRHNELPIFHHMQRDFQLCDDLIARLSELITACPLPPGGMMIFDSKLPHGTPTNQSNTRRRALQFHYSVNGVSRVAERVRLKSFGGEGSGVEC